MAGNNQQLKRIKAVQYDQDPPAPPILSRAASKVRHAGGACLRLLARPSTAGPLLITSICLAVAYRGRGRAEKPGRGGGAGGATDEVIRTVFQRSMSVAVLHGGQVALQRIIDSQEARLNGAMLENAEDEFENLLHPGDGRILFGKLQSVAGKLEMSGKEDEAVVKLRQAMLNAKPHEAHELGMLLVEMLIYKGDYDEALSQKCLYDEGISDARAPLYKAVIYSLKQEDMKAAENFKTFQNMQIRLFFTDAYKEGTPLYDVINDFGVFQTIVKNLKAEIDKVKDRKLHQHL